MSNNIDITQLSKSIRDVPKNQVDEVFTSLPEIIPTPPSPKRSRGRPKKEEETPKSQQTETDKEKEKQKEFEKLGAAKFKIKAFLTSKYLRNRFPEEIRDLPEKTLADCESKLEAIRRYFKLAFKKDACENLFKSCVGIFEDTVSPFLPYVHGLQNDLEEHPEMYMCEIEEIAIDSSDFMVPGPWGRLALNLIMVVNERRKLYYTPGFQQRQQQEYEQTHQEPLKTKAESLNKIIESHPSSSTNNIKSILKKTNVNRDSSNSS